MTAVTDLTEIPWPWPRRSKQYSSIWSRIHEHNADMLRRGGPYLLRYLDQAPAYYAQSPGLPPPSRLTLRLLLPDNRPWYQRLRDHIRGRAYGVHIPTGNGKMQYVRVIAE